jgi:hypothetical protein
MLSLRISNRRRRDWRKTLMVAGWSSATAWWRISGPSSPSWLQRLLEQRSAVTPKTSRVWPLAEDAIRLLAEIDGLIPSWPLR